MKLTRNPYLVFAAFAIVSLLLLNVGHWADVAIVLVGWSIGLVGSVLSIIQFFKRGRAGNGGYGQFAIMSDRVRRWILDERE
jgi:hypothetical protein